MSIRKKVEDAVLKISPNLKIEWAISPLDVVTKSSVWLGKGLQYWILKENTAYHPLILNDLFAAPWLKQPAEHLAQFHPKGDYNPFQDVTKDLLWGCLCFGHIDRGPEVLVCLERPVVSVDDQNRPHRNDGPCVEFPDGQKLFAINGVLIGPSLGDLGEQIVMRPKKMTRQQILGIENAEIRRIAMERYGLEELLVDSKIIDHYKDVDGIDQLLVQLGERDKFLICACSSTARRYIMPAPVDATKVKQVQQALRAPDRALAGLFDWDTIRKITERDPIVTA